MPNASVSTLLLKMMKTAKSSIAPYNEYKCQEIPKANLIRYVPTNFYSMPKTGERCEFVSFLYKIFLGMYDKNCSFKMQRDHLSHLQRNDD